MSDPITSWLYVFILWNFIHIFSHDRFLLDYLLIAASVKIILLINDIARSHSFDVLRLHNASSHQFHCQTESSNGLSSRSTWIKFPVSFAIHDKAKSIWLTAYRLPRGKADLWVILRDDARMVTLKNVEREREREREEEFSNFTTKGYS